MKKLSWKKKRERNRKHKLPTALTQFAGRVHFGIRSKLITTFLIPVAFIILLGTLSYQQTASSLKGLYQSSAMQILGKSADYLEVVLLEVETSSYDVCDDKELVNYFSNVPEEGVTLSYVGNRFNSHLGADAYIENGYFISTEKGEHLSTNPAVTFDAKAFDTFTQTEDYVQVTSRNRKVWIGESEFLNLYKPAGETPYDNRRLTMIRRVENILTGQDIGFLILELRQTVLEQLLDEIDLGEGSKVILTAQDSGELMKAEQYPENVEDTVFTHTSSYVKIQQSIDKSGSWNIKTGNGQYWMCYYYLGDLGNCIIGLIPQETLMESANGIRFSTILIVLVAAVVVTIIGTMMASGMSKSINKIVAGVALAAEGNLTVEIKTKRKDEFGKLGNSINSMIAAMKALIGKVSTGVFQVEEAADKVSMAKENVSDTAESLVHISEQIQEGGYRQDSGAKQCTDAMEELSGKIEQVVQGTAQIDNIVKTTRNMVAGGIGMMDDLSRSSDKTTDNLEHIVEEIKVLADKVNNVYGIIEVITEIADQTSLLSLNASIEAARAGELGRGFSVVASEVKKLAEESLGATEQISRIIDEVQKQSRKTLEYAQAAEGVLEQQDAAVEGAISTFRTINTHVEKLSEAVNQISNQAMAIDTSRDVTVEAIRGISAVIEENSASAGEMAEGISSQRQEVETLSGYAETLQMLSDQLKDAIHIFTITKEES